MNELFSHLKDGKPLTFQECFEKILATETEETKIPNGYKSDCWIVLKSCDRRDDCGAYASKSYNVRTSTYFRKEGDKLELIVKDAETGLYTKTWKKKALPEQPHPDSLVQMTKYYATSVQGPPFLHRSIVRLDKVAGDGSEKKGYYVVFYEGKSHGSKTPHGNARRKRHPYRATPRHVLEKVRDGLRRGKRSKDVLMEMRRLPSPERPKDLRQIQNQAALIARDTSVPYANLSDEILAVMNDFHNTKNDFVQGILHIHRDAPPAIVLFKDQQIRDLVQFCTVEGAWHKTSAAATDKTYCVSSAFLTAIVFPNKKLEREAEHPGSWPTWLGPVLLHWVSDKVTFLRWFETIKSAMGDSVPEGFSISSMKLMMGSDSEEAIVSALAECWPEAVQLLCTKHISDNVYSHILEMDLSADQRSKLHHDIMALRLSKDLADFKLRGQRIVEQVANDVDIPEAEYIEKVLDKMLTYNVEPRLQEGDIVPFNFTTNISESYNAYIKFIIDFRPQKLPKLIKRLEDIVDMQYCQLRDAVHNHGDFRLTRHFSKYAISDEVWAAWDTRQDGEALKVEAVTKLLDAKFKRERSGTVVSSDGRLTMPNFSRTARKPHQTKGARSERTDHSRQRKSRSRSRGAYRGRRGSM